MADRSGARRNPARYLAPVLIIVIGLAIYVIVHRSLAGTATSSNTGALISTSTGTTTTPGGTSGHRRGPKFYVVKVGDSLTAISQKTHVDYATILALNPKLAANPGALQPGDRVRLRR